MGELLNRPLPWFPYLCHGAVMTQECAWSVPGTQLAVTSPFLHPCQTSEYPSNPDWLLEIV